MANANKYSNTTLVKVKSWESNIVFASGLNSNTTLVKVKLYLLAEMKKTLQNSNTTLVKVKWYNKSSKKYLCIFKYNTC